MYHMNIPRVPIWKGPNIFQLVDKLSREEQWTLEREVAETQGINSVWKCMTGCTDVTCYLHLGIVISWRVFNRMSWQLLRVMLKIKRIRFYEPFSQIAESLYIQHSKSALPWSFAGRAEMKRNFKTKTKQSKTKFPNIASFLVQNVSNVYRNSKPTPRKETRYPKETIVVSKEKNSFAFRSWPTNFCGNRLSSDGQARKLTLITGSRPCHGFHSQ